MFSECSPFIAACFGFMDAVSSLISPRILMMVLFGGGRIDAHGFL